MNYKIGLFQENWFLKFGVHIMVISGTPNYLKEN